MDDNIGIYNFPTFKRGDTFRARDFATYTSSVDGTALAINSALMQIRTKAGVIVHTWTTQGDAPNATITGAGYNVVTLGRVEKSVTQNWPVGDHVYDLEVEFTTDTAAETKLGGLFPVSADVSRLD